MAMKRSASFANQCAGTGRLIYSAGCILLCDAVADGRVSALAEQTWGADKKELSDKA